MIEPARISILLLALYGICLWVSHGEYWLPGILVTFSGFALFCALYLARTPAALSPRAAERLLTALFILFYSLVFYNPMLRSLTNVRAAWVLWSLLLTVPLGFLLFQFSRTLRLGFVLTLVLLAQIHYLVMIVNPAPEIDIWLFFRKASLHLMAGENPYSQTDYPEIYNNRYGYPPGLHYLPASVYCLAPFQKVFGDVRVGLWVAQVGSALLLGLLARRLGLSERIQGLAVLVWLIFPPGLPVLENSWIDTLLGFWTLAAVNLWRSSRFGSAALCLAVALATKQTMVIMALVTAVFFAAQPVAATRRRGLACVILSVLGALLLMAPYALWDWSSFWTSVTQVFRNPVRLDSFNLVALAGHLYGLKVEFWQTLLVYAALLPLVLWRLSRSRGWVDWSGGLVMLLGLTFYFGKQAFLNYYDLLALFVLTHFLLATGETSDHEAPESLRFNPETLLQAATLMLSSIALAVLASGRNSPFPLVMVSCGMGLAWLGVRRLRGRSFRHDVTTALVLASWLLYLANGQVSGSADTLPARLLPLSLARQGTFSLDAFPAACTRDGPYSETPGAPPYSVLKVGEHHVSAYAVGTSLAALPLYLPSLLGGVDSQSDWWLLVEKLSASFLAALSVGLVHLTLRRVAGWRLALAASLAYALGSSTWSLSSQGLYQHGAAQLGLAAGLLCLVRGREQARWIGVAGFPLAFAVVARPAAGLLVAALGLYVLVHHRRQFWLFVLCALPWVTFQLAYNQVYLGDIWRFPLGPRVADPSGGASSVSSAWLWRQLWGEGLVGLLLSPARGLLIYSPVFAFAAAGAALAWRRGGDPLVRWSSLGLLATLGLLASFAGWYGGHCYGPRMLADGTPFLALCLYPLEGWLTRRVWARVAFGLCLAWSVAAHAVGVFSSSARTWNVDVDVNNVPDALWSWSNNQLMNPPRALYDGFRIGLGGLPTSQSRPSALQASYRAALGPSWSSRYLRLVFEATNPGPVVWLAAGKGHVSLGWRWFREGVGEPVLEGRLNLCRAVFPGESYRFEAYVPKPIERGRYALIVGLIVDDVAWTEEMGGTPLLRIFRDF